MGYLHHVTRALVIAMIAAISTLFVSLLIAMVTGKIVTSASQFMLFFAVAGPITLFLLSPYAVLLKAKHRPFSLLSQEWMGLVASLVVMAVTHLLGLRLLRIPNIPLVGEMSMNMSLFLLGSVQLLLAATAVIAIRRMGTELQVSDM